MMLVAGDPGVLGPLQEGSLTGVTCPSTCDKKHDQTSMLVKLSTNRHPNFQLKTLGIHVLPSFQYREPSRFSESDTQWTNHSSRLL